MGSADNGWDELSEPLGRGIARAGWHLLTGGRTGVMESVARGFVSIADRAGFSLGIMPDGFRPNPYVEIPVYTQLNAAKDMDSEAFQWSRNHVNVRTADALVVLPGGAGTQSELTLAANWRKPVVALLGATGRIGTLERETDTTLRLSDDQEVGIVENADAALVFLAESLTSETNYSPFDS
jgi:uncharacterized protein (TIGR00725 family)